MNKFVCEKCGLSFENGKVKSNHIRWKHNDIEKYKQSNKISALLAYDKKYGKLKSFDVKCELCKKDFQVKERENQFPKKEKYFCSKKCAGEYSQSFVDKEKLSKTIKRLWNEGKYGEKYTPKLLDFTCVMCGKVFQKITDNWTYKNNPRKTCSDDCYRKRMSQSSRENPNCGGETNYKKYRYNGVWMDSTWEKKLAEWMDLNNILWERSRKSHQFLWTDKDGKKRRYYPDFYLPKYKIYVDTKNPYLMKCDEYKIKSVVKENKINLIYGNLNNVRKELTELYSVI